MTDPFASVRDVVDVVDAVVLPSLSASSEPVPGEVMKKSRGRPPGTFNWHVTEEVLGKVELMSGIGLSEEVMARLLDTSQDTFTRRKVDTPALVEAIARGRAKVEFLLARTLYNAASSGNLTAAIWLEKTRFNRSERVRVDEVKLGAADLSKLSDVQLERLAAGESLVSVVR